jgi:hypothetical protein
VTGLREPVLPAGLSTSVGGPAGRRLLRPERGPLASLAPVVLLLALPLSLATLRQAGCLTSGWKGGTPLWRQCASPLVQSVATSDLARGLPAYLTGSVRADVPVPQGSVTALLAGIAPGFGTGQQRWFLLLWTVFAAALLAGLVVVVGTVRRHPASDPVALALSPVLALTVLLSADLLPVCLAVVAVWAWSRNMSRLAGALAGVALLGGVLPAVVLLAMALVPPDAGRPAVRRLVGTAVATVLVLAALVSLLDPGTLTRPVRAWLSAGAGPGSPWYLFTLVRHPVGATSVVVLAVLGWGLAAALLVLMARRRPRPVVAATALVGLAVVLMTAPAFPPAAALWLVPFVALTGVGWRDHLLWAGAEAVHAVALFGYLVERTDPAKGLPAGWYSLALLLRLVAVGWVAHQAWVAASWGDAAPAGTLARLPSEGPVENRGGPVGSSAYPPVTERP